MCARASMRSCVCGCVCLGRILLRVVNDAVMDGRRHSLPHHPASFNGESEHESAHIRRDVQAKGVSLFSILVCRDGSGGLRKGFQEVGAEVGHGMRCGAREGLRLRLRRMRWKHTRSSVRLTPGLATWFTSDQIRSTRAHPSETASPPPLHTTHHHHARIRGAVECGRIVDGSVDLCPRPAHNRRSSSSR